MTFKKKMSKRTDSKRVDNAYVLPTNIKLNVEISKDINDDYFKISRKKQEYFFKDTKKEKR